MTSTSTRNLSAPKRLKYSWILAVITLLIVLWIVGRELRSIDWHGVSRAWSALPTANVAASLGFSLVSFFMLGLLDVLAARCVAPHQISAKRATFAGAMSHAFSNTLGFPALTGSLIRYRIYASAGLGVAVIAQIVALAAFGIAMGFTVVTTLALLWQPSLAQGWGRAVGIVICAALLAFLLWLRESPRSVPVARWTLVFPDSATAAWQMVVGGIEMVAAIAALYVLLPANSAPPFIDFLPIYVGAVLVGLLSHVPGGLGVFEVIVLATFPAQARSDALAAMLCYRITYSAVPFVCAGMAWLVFESRTLRKSQR
ncbi:MAG: lysylphosphatidylglycerol synthase domain-containing protein [Dokdonella sp.]